MDLKSVEHVKAASKAIKDGFAMLNKGPFDWYIDELVAHSEALMSYAPFQVGDRCRIAYPPSCEGGWRGSEDTLAHDKIGTISDVGHDKSGFFFEWVPDVETYWDDTAKAYKEKTYRHSFGLRAKHLAKVS